LLGGREDVFLRQVILSDQRTHLGDRLAQFRFAGLLNLLFELFTLLQKGFIRGHGHFKVCGCWALIMQLNSLRSNLFMLKINT
jgi:hypothetical protein